MLTGISSIGSNCRSNSRIGLNWEVEWMIAVKDKLREHSEGKNENNTDPERTREIRSALTTCEAQGDKWPVPCHVALLAEPRVDSRFYNPQSKPLTLHCIASPSGAGRGGNTNCHFVKWFKKNTLKHGYSLPSSSKGVHFWNPRNSPANAVTFWKTTSSLSNMLDLGFDAPHGNQSIPHFSDVLSHPYVKPLYHSFPTSVA